MAVSINFMLSGELLSCRVSRWSLDSNTTKVIVIIRLHAMYEKSRKILAFLSGLFLAMLIVCVVIAVIQSKGVSGGKL
jgi:hypothetical protein